MLNALTRWRSVAAALALVALTTPALATLDDVHQWSTTAATNTDVGGTSIAEGMAPSGVNNAMREMMAELRRDSAGIGSNIASAGTTAICATGTSKSVNVTGTTTITSLGTANAGCWRIVIFTGALTLTQNATSLILPGAANITTVADDVAGFLSLGSGNWRMIWFSRIPLTAPLTLTSSATGALLTMTSTDAGAASGPSLQLNRSSASPAASDLLGAVIFDGKDSGGNDTLYAYQIGKILDPTNASEDGAYQFQAQVAGVDTTVLAIGPGVTLNNATDKGIGTLNASAGLYVNGHGTVAQYVETPNSTYTDLAVILPVDDSIPQITEGDEVMTVAITPTNASSTLRIEVNAHLGGAIGDQQACAIFVDATANALAAGSTSSASAAIMSTLTFTHTVSAASTSSRTYRLRCGSAVAANAKLNGHNTTRLFGGVATSRLSVTEILPQ